MRIHQKALTLLTLCCLLTLNPALHAEESTGMIDLGEAIGGLLSFTFIGVPGVVFTGGALTYVIKGSKNSSGWKYGGLVTGGLNLVVGTLWMVTAINENDDVKLAYFAIPHLVIGVLDLSLTIWASNLPEKTETSTQLAISPTVFADSAGQPAPGVALTLMGW